MADNAGKPLDTRLRGISTENIVPLKCVRVGNRSATERADRRADTFPESEKKQSDARK
jgi:hypothetical protein